MNLKYFPLIIFIISFLSCKSETTKNMEKIKLGMSKDEVITIIGNPIGTGNRVDTSGVKTIYYIYPNTLFSASGNVVYFDTNMIVVDLSLLYN